MRKILVVLGAFVVIAFSTGSHCNEVTNPIDRTPTFNPTNQPFSTNTPTSAPTSAPTLAPTTTPFPTVTPIPGAPVVAGTSTDIIVDGSTFDISGTGLGNCPIVIVTLDTTTNSYVITCLFGDDQSIQVTVPTGIPPGTYNVCVTRNSMKGCSSFQITKH